MTKDPERPFIVDTKDLSIKVHGTRFNVRSYTEDKGTEATLLEGSISLLVKGDLNQQDIFLVPGEKAILDKKQVKLEKFDVDGYQSWQKRTVYIQRQDTARDYNGTSNVCSMFRL